MTNSNPALSLIDEVDQRIKQDAQYSKPIPLPSLQPVLKLTPEMLPTDIRDYIFDVSERLQCPPEFCAVNALVGLSALLGRKRIIAPKEHDDWKVTPNLWGAIVGAPSSMKSPSIAKLLFPVHEIEAALQKSHSEQTKELDLDSEVTHLKKKAAQRVARDHVESGDEEAARAIFKELQQSEDSKPPLPRVIVNDATIEALGERLNENPNGLMLLRDELSGWLSKMQMEEYASDRAFYLECFNGDGRYTTDRIGRGTIVIEHCILSILGGIQPSKLENIVKKAASGLENDGLIQRFQLLVWPDTSPSWKYIDRKPKAQAEDQYRQCFYRINTLEVEDPKNPPQLHFSKRAQELFIDWHIQIQTEARSGTLLPLLEEHLLKMPNTVCALALLFSLIDGKGQEIDEVSTARALEWATFLRSHAERLYSAATSAAINSAKLILKRKDKLPSPFSYRDISRAGWAGLSTKESVYAAIDVLIEYQHVRAEITNSPGSKPKTELYWTTDYIEKRSQSKQIHESMRGVI